MEDSTVTIDKPGTRCDLPRQVINDLRLLLPNGGGDKLVFFGGHPVSMTKMSCNEIFTTLNKRNQSPYLLCEKTDGVRYIMVLARVNGEEGPTVKTYLISREGNNRLVSYDCNMLVGTHWKPTRSSMQSVIEVVDGELILDVTLNQERTYRYLIFDLLVHLGTNIMVQPLQSRLELATRFVSCNQTLLHHADPYPPPNAIQLILKDFFRLTCPKFLIVEFLLKSYTKCLPHENDGIIFNHAEKPYLIGTNAGYVKWKPSHLNTVDFFVVPNENVADRHPNRVLDLYLGRRDTTYERKGYKKSFYNFTAVSEADYQSVVEACESRRIKQFETRDNEEEGLGEFEGGLIAQCRFEQTSQDERVIFKDLLSIHRKTQQIWADVMYHEDENEEMARIGELKKMLFDRSWKIYKFRVDKGTPNNNDTARRIEESIKDNINEEELIQKNSTLMKKMEENLTFKRSSYE